MISPKYVLFPLLTSLLVSVLLVGCQKNAPTQEENKSPKKDYIRKIEGKSEQIPDEVVAKGEVLVAYSGCADCHRVDTKAKGPAFRDIAQRYPVQPAYVDMLARKVISGGFGSWGNPIMSPHPDLKFEDAQTMVYYVLSLK
ncbi:c-type cytochrome [Cyclobacterium sp.]|uniref:c-type cytochrome n=1 Tax=Cyclobacterium sp. TaxID=1966343 RepID=UPI0019B7A34D|nr:c-type cytochrome [Cyclobacterium sp.]MBD3630452.1 c-type cytochrome [Cyclobacterium sp.]